MNKLLLLFCLGWTMPACATVLTVGRDAEYGSIIEAVAMAKPGDTIRVYSGLYKEGNILIDKTLVLMGVDHPILDGEKKNEIISVKAHNVVISGFTFRNSGISSLVDFAAVKTYNATGSKILNNKVEDCFFGIYVQNGKETPIQDNVLVAHNLRDARSGNGIHCWKSTGMRIVNNSMTGHRDGIYFEFVHDSMITGNVSRNNIRYGLHFMFSNRNTYANNIFEHNGAGVAVMYSSFVVMTDNKFVNNWGASAYGLLLKEINDSRIDGNVFSENTCAIYVEGANRMSMAHNRFFQNGWALKIQASCSEVLLEHNDFIGNSFDVGTNGSIVLNTFRKNYWDKYEGYDLNKDRIGDVPYHPISLYSMIIEQYPAAMGLFRSFITTLMDKSEKIIPSLTPENLVDTHPAMKPQTL